MHFLNTSQNARPRPRSPEVMQLNYDPPLSHFLLSPNSQPSPALPLPPLSGQRQTSAAMRFTYIIISSRTAAFPLQRSGEKKKRPYLFVSPLLLRWSFYANGGQIWLIHCCCKGKLNARGFFFSWAKVWGVHDGVGWKAMLCGKKKWDGIWFGRNGGTGGDILS